MKAFFADINEPGLARDGGGRNGPEAWGVKLRCQRRNEKQQRENLDRRIAERAAKLRRGRDSALAEQRRAVGAHRRSSRFNRGELRWQFQRPLSVIGPWRRP